MGNEVMGTAPPAMPGVNTPYNQPGQVQHLGVNPSNADPSGMQNYMMTYMPPDPRQLIMLNNLSQMLQANGMSAMMPGQTGFGNNVQAATLRQYQDQLLNSLIPNNADQKLYGDLHYQHNPNLMPFIMGQNQDYQNSLLQAQKNYLQRNQTASGPYQAPPSYLTQDDPNTPSYIKQLALKWNTQNDPRMGGTPSYLTPAPVSQSPYRVANSDASMEMGN